ncbi:hypothetical protein CHS0354_034302 [Potamilus streckersoni]|uniref:Secreted protein n=1 Tax=Potamilus streckersoni TaxID=2493646 RepID=A0AAE0TB90_9BIVA|nr:hypothetical protein CHS0354_034302 [Potamilus streckersoni]
MKMIPPSISLYLFLALSNSVFFLTKNKQANFLKQSTCILKTKRPLFIFSKLMHTMKDMECQIHMKQKEINIPLSLYKLSVVCQVTKVILQPVVLKQHKG